MIVEVASPIKSQKYKVFWRYEQKGKKEKEKRFVTKCVIEVFGTKVPFKEGVAICNPVDNFEKNEGRKESLTKALVGMSYEDRSAFWSKYMSEIGNKHLCKKG